MGGTGGNVTIANGGLATFGGVNTYTGFTTINAGGELDMSGNGSIAASKAVINNGIFDISCLCSSSGSITSLSGASTGIVNLGANTLTITNGNGTYAGAILDSGLGGGLAITGGKEVLTGASSYTGATTITGATLEVDGSISGTSRRHGEFRRHAVGHRYDRSAGGHHQWRRHLPAVGKPVRRADDRRNAC